MQELLSDSYLKSCKKKKKTYGLNLSAFPQNIDTALHSEWPIFKSLSVKKIEFYFLLTRWEVHRKGDKVLLVRNSA